MSRFCKACGLTTELCDLRNCKPLPKPGSKAPNAAVAYLDNQIRALAKDIPATAAAAFASPGVQRAYQLGREIGAIEMAARLKEVLSAGGGHDIP